MSMCLTEIVPDVQISSKESRRPEAAEEDLLQTLDQTIVPAQQVGQGAHIPIPAGLIMPFDQHVDAVAQLVLNL